MSTQQPIVQFNKVSDMLDNDPAYLKEFCEAAVISFTTFQEEYRHCMRNRDFKKLRRSGHRIKPVAQMLGVDKVLDEYKKSKVILEQGEDDSQIEAAIDRMNTLCNKITDEFRAKIDNSES